MMVSKPQDAAPEAATIFESGPLEVPRGTLRREDTVVCHIKGPASKSGFPLPTKHTANIMLPSNIAKAAREQRELQPLWG